MNNILGIEVVVRTVSEFPDCRAKRRITFEEAASANIDTEQTVRRYMGELTEELIKLLDRLGALK